MFVVPRRARDIQAELSSLPMNRLGINSRLGRISVTFATLTNYVRNELEVLLFPILNEKNISSYVTCSGLENLEVALSRGKGVMLLFGHFGANQMVMPAIGYRGIKMSQLSAPATVWKEKLPERQFSRVEGWVLRTRWEHELSLPVKHINIFGSLKEAFLTLKRNEVLGVAIDGGGGKKRVPVDFLGRKALFSTGAMEIAQRTGCSVVPVFMVRHKDGHNNMILEPPLDLIGGEGDERLRINTETFVRRLESYVLKHPDHYLNFLVLRSFMARKGDTPFMVDGETAK
jgi:KDO2-lipid IV(A) lauroyltransferase